MAEGLHGDISAIVVEIVASCLHRGLLWLWVGSCQRQEEQTPWIRKVLPNPVFGTDTIEMHADALSKGDRVVVVDLLATGGTAKAACDLIQQFGAEVVHASFVVDLAFLGGADVLPCSVSALLTY